MADILPGYRKLPGKSRRYETPTGEIISRRQYENIRFRSAGWKSWSEFQKVSNTQEYRRFKKAAAKQKGQKSTRGILKPDSDFNREFLAAYRTDFPTNVGGPFDEFLKDIGLREPDADYQVGDTPGPNK